jgi:hypothetical protein
MCVTHKHAGLQAGLPRARSGDLIDAPTGPLRCAALRCAAQLSAIVDIRAYLTAWSCDLAGVGLQLSAIVEMWVFGHTDMLLYSENANYPMASYVSLVNA